MYYVYEWYVKKTNEIIYVGKGVNNRYKVKKHNKFFNDFITRNDCESRIIKYFDDEKEAFLYEAERIEELQNIGMCKCNIYGGGTGGTTNWWTEERKIEYSKNNVMKSEKQRNRMKNNNPMFDKELSKIAHDKKKRKVCIGDKVYDGIVDIANEYGVYDTAIQYWLERGYSSDKKPCYYYGEPVPKVVLRKGNCNKRAIIIDGEKFDSLKSACEFIGVKNTSWLSKLLKKGNCTYKGHTCKYDNQQPSQGKTN